MQKKGENRKTKREKPNASLPYIAYNIHKPNKLKTKLNTLA